MGNAQHLEETHGSASGSGLSRRAFLRSAATAVAAVAWAPAFKVWAGDGCAAPVGFPEGIELYRQAYRNWAGDIRVDDVWTCAPQDADQVVAVVNWALEHGFRARPQGMRHNFSPLTIADGSSCEGVVLLDTTQHLTEMRLGSGDPPSVRVGSGATMESLLEFLHAAGLGMTACPAPGDISIGGALAIGAHGTAIPARGETRAHGHTFGSLSNLVLSLTAVVWDPALRRYVLRTFDRTDPDGAALLVHLGRALITEFTLQTGADHNLRCQSLVDVPATELFAQPSAAGARSFASYLDRAGRAEAIWFPFTESPWLKVWSVAPDQPPGTRAVSEPYNYPFSDNVPEPIAVFADEMVRRNPASTPVFSRMSFEAVRAGLVATASADIWGASKDLLLYIKPTTLRVTTNGYVVHTRRSSIQRVVADFWARYSTLIESYRARGSYPINMPLEIRVTGLDHPSESDVDGARAPLLSALSPYGTSPEWDVAIWFNALTFPGTPDANRFYRELETWMFEHYQGWAAVRPEWSKGWAYTETAAWTDATMLDDVIPDGYRGGGKHRDQPSRGKSGKRHPSAARGRGLWDEAVARLDALDPHRVFTSALLDRLL